MTGSSGMGGEEGGSRKRGYVHIYRFGPCPPGWKPLNSWKVLPGKSDCLSGALGHTR